MTDNQDRAYWLQTMIRIADPVLHSLAKEKLKELMPIRDVSSDRGNYAHLEAFGRLASGMAPWIENGPKSGEEGQLRKKYAILIRKGIEVATDLNSPDYMNFEYGEQPLVDTAFLAHAIVRAPNELYTKLSSRVKQNLIRAFKMIRIKKPYFSNWLLFSAMIEVALFRCGEEDWDRMRIDFALKQHEQWYLGDGVYGDGPEFRMDYYNSFVIQPMLVDIIKIVQHEADDWHELKAKIDIRAKRFAVIQERSISPEGTFPVVGRSLAYRFGAFQHLAQMALQHQLEESISPSQVRCALTAVIRKMIEMPGTFDEDGWLRIGFCGNQPELGERYISTGSLYLCATVFLPLGLEGNDPFWQGEAEWTSKKAWSGKQIGIDQALG
jgi:hypothetical protein